MPTIKVRCTKIESHTRDVAIVTFADIPNLNCDQPERLAVQLAASFYARPDRYVVGQTYDLSLPLPTP